MLACIRVQQIDKKITSSRQSVADIADPLELYLVSCIYIYIYNIYIYIYKHPSLKWIYPSARIVFFLFSIYMYMYVRLNAQSLITSSWLYTGFFFSPADQVAPELSRMSIPRPVDALDGAVDLLENDPRANSHVYLQSIDALSRIIKAVFRWVRSEKRVPLPPFVSHSSPPHARTHSGDPFSLVAFGLEFIGRRTITHWFTDHLPRVGGTAPGAPTFTHRWKRFPGSGFLFYSKPRAELRLQNRGGVSPAHYSEVVEQIRHRRRFPMPRLPQVQNVLGRTGLSREVIDVPVKHERKHRAAWLPRKMVYERLHRRRDRPRLGKVCINGEYETAVNNMKLCRYHEIF